MKRWWLIVGGIGMIAWLQSALYSVDQAEFGYVTRFGEPIAVHDGADAAGLHLKAPWPIDGVQRIDRRLQVFDLPPTETLTRDRQGRTVDKTIAVDAFVCWRVPDAASADRFIRVVGTIEQARRLLTPRLTGRLSAVISNLPMDDLIQVADAATVESRSERLRRQLLGQEPVGAEATAEDLQATVRREYGIEIVEVRLRRLSFPEAVRAGIAERIRSERQRKVTDYQSEGNREYTRIVSEARREAARIVAEARARRQRIEGEADAEADAIRNDAHARDREFYAFLLKLAAYKAMLAETRDILLLSSKNELFDLLLSPPKPGGKKEKD